MHTYMYRGIQYYIYASRWLQAGFKMALSDQTNLERFLCEQRMLRDIFSSTGPQVGSALCKFENANIHWRIHGQSTACLYCRSRLVIHHNITGPRRLDWSRAQIDRVSTWLALSAHRRWQELELCRDSRHVVNTRSTKMFPFSNQMAMDTQTMKMGMD